MAAGEKRPGWCHWLGYQCELSFWEWLKRVWKSVLRDHCDDMAAQMSYFTLVALFPFFIVLAAIVSFLPFTVVWPHVLTWITMYFPESVQPYIFRTVLKLTQDRMGLLSFALPTSVWAATRGVVSLMDGLNHAYNVRETRSILRRRAISFGVMLVFASTFLTAFALLTWGGLVGDWFADQVGWGRGFTSLWHVFRWAVSLSLLNLAVQFANHTLPNGWRPWRWVSAGSIFVVIVWLPATIAFNAFFHHFTAEASTYGALATFFVLMFWVWITSFILLVGAEMNAQLEEIPSELRARDNSPRTLIAS